jgi:hypothetical protein
MPARVTAAISRSHTARWQRQAAHRQWMVGAHRSILVPSHTQSIVLLASETTYEHALRHVCVVGSNRSNLRSEHRRTPFIE